MIVPAAVRHGQKEIANMRSFRTALIAPIAIVAAGSLFTPSRVQSQADSADVEQRMLALNQMALSHVSKGEYAAAVRAYEEAIRMKPESSDLARSRPRRWVQNNLAWLLATAPDSAVRDGAKALALAEQLVVWKRDDAAYLDTFAAAYAELGRFDDAVKTQRAAVARLGRGATRDEYRRHLRSYEERKPWREP
jgi:tetratricopeptide (TPR) repeat protein